MSEMTSHRRNWRHAGTETLVSALANQSLIAAVPVAVVAVIAGIVSYSHIEALALAQHQSLADARMFPFSVDFLIVAGSVVVLAGYWLGWIGVAAGVAATLFANVESGLPFGPLAATVAAWPAVAFSVASFILERWLKRQAEPSEQQSVLQADLGTAKAELAGLRAEMEVARESIEAAEAGRVAAQQEAAESAAKADILTRKLTAIPEPKPTRKPPAKKPATSPRKGAVSPATQVPNDVDAQAEALAILAAEPDIKGAQLGPRVGKSERWGQMLKNKLATTAATSEGQDPEE